MKHSKNNKPISQFESDVHEVFTSGKIVKVVNLPSKKGVNLVLDYKITNSQAENIARYIRSEYKFDAYFFKKDHAIKVIYSK